MNNAYCLHDAASADSTYGSVNSDTVSTNLATKAKEMDIKVSTTDPSSRVRIEADVSSRYRSKVCLQFDNLRVCPGSKSRTSDGLGFYVEERKLSTKGSHCSVDLNDMSSGECLSVMSNGDWISNNSLIFCSFWQVSETVIVICQVSDQLDCKLLAVGGPQVIVRV